MSGWGAWNTGPPKFQRGSSNEFVGVGLTELGFGRSFVPWVLFGATEPGAWWTRMAHEVARDGCGMTSQTLVKLQDAIDVHDTK